MVHKLLPLLKRKTVSYLFYRCYPDTTIVVTVESMQYKLKEVLRVI